MYNCNILENNLRRGTRSWARQTLVTCGQSVLAMLAETQAVFWKKTLKSETWRQASKWTRAGESIHSVSLARSGARRYNQTHQGRNTLKKKSDHFLIIYISKWNIYFSLIKKWNQHVNEFVTSTQWVADKNHSKTMLR